MPEKTSRLKAVEYEVTWVWRQELGYIRYPYYDREITATTAPRAIGKLRRRLAKEYSFEKNDLIILSAEPVCETRFQ